MATAVLPLATALPSERRIAFVLMDYEDTDPGFAQMPFEEAYERMFAGQGVTPLTRSVAGFYDYVTDGQMQITGAVFDRIRLPRSGFAWVNDADANNRCWTPAGRPPRFGTALVGSFCLDALRHSRHPATINIQRIGDPHVNATNCPTPIPPTGNNWCYRPIQRTEMMYEYFTVTAEQMATSGRTHDGAPISVFDRDDYDTFIWGVAIHPNGGGAGAGLNERDNKPNIIEDRLEANTPTSNVHEIGHTIGLNHPPGYMCVNADWGDEAQCTQGRNDPWVTMGSGSGLFSAFERYQLRIWDLGEDIATAEQQPYVQAFTIRSNTTGLGNRGVQLRLPREFSGRERDGAGNWVPIFSRTPETAYYLEYRRNESYNTGSTGRDDRLLEVRVGAQSRAVSNAPMQVHQTAAYLSGLNSLLTLTPWTIPGWAGSALDVIRLEEDEVTVVVYPGCNGRPVGDFVGFVDRYGCQPLNPVFASTPGPDRTVGIRFKPRVSGVVGGIRVYRTSSHTDDVEAAIWKTASGGLPGVIIAAANGQPEGDDPDGWHTLAFPTPVWVQAGQEYVASYYTRDGSYVRTDTAPNPSPIDVVHSAVVPGNAFPNTPISGAQVGIDLAFVPGVAAGANEGTWQPTRRPDDAGLGVTFEVPVAQDLWSLRLPLRAVDANLSFDILVREGTFLRDTTRGVSDPQGVSETGWAELVLRRPMRLEANTTYSVIVRLQAPNPGWRLRQTYSSGLSWPYMSRGIRFLNAIAVQSDFSEIVDVQRRYVLELNTSHARPGAVYDLVSVGALGGALPRLRVYGDTTDTITRWPERFAAWARQPGVRQIEGDFDGDGAVDVGLLGPYGWENGVWQRLSSLPVALNRPDGWQVESVPGVPGAGRWGRTAGSRVVPGDYDGDGNTDVAICGASTWNTVPVHFSNGDGSWRYTNLRVVDVPRWCADANVDVFAGDVDGDGRDDLVLTGGSTWSTLPVALSNGDGTFRVYNDPTPLFGPVARVGRNFVGDFNGDRLIDVVSVVGVGTRLSTDLALSNGDGTWTEVRVDSSSAFAPYADESRPCEKTAIADFNGDGRDDIGAIVTCGRSTPRFAFSTGQGFTTKAYGVGAYEQYANRPTAQVAVGDFDRDGFADIVASGSHSSLVFSVGGATSGVRYRELSGADFIRDAEGGQLRVLQSGYSTQAGRPYGRSTGGIATPDRYNIDDPPLTPCGANNVPPVTWAFECDGNWTEVKSGSGVSGFSNAHARSGSYSLLLRDMSTSEPEVFASNDVFVLPQQRYRVATQMYRISGAGVQVQVTFYDPSGSEIAKDTRVYSTTLHRWGESSTVVTAPATARTLRVQISITDAAMAEVFIDDVRVVPFTPTNECGDGTLEPFEECDDGNTVDGDGCSSTCQLEGVCGDGNVDDGEQCDDGNTVDNDGCSSRCTIEEGSKGVGQPCQQDDECFGVLRCRPLDGATPVRACWLPGVGGDGCDDDFDCGPNFSCNGNICE